MGDSWRIGWKRISRISINRYAKTLQFPISGNGYICPLTHIIIVYVKVNRTVSRFFNVVELPNPVEGLVKRGTGGIVFKGRWNIRIRDLVAVARFFVLPQNSRIFPVIGSIYWSRILRAAQVHERNKQHDQKKYINEMT
jgi:hypothetical protein